MLYALLLGCAEPEVVTDSAEAADIPTEAPEPDRCDALELRVDGPDPPAVGDTWTVWLWCEDALLIGAMRVWFEPPDFAGIEDNQVTFFYAGDATLTVQAGQDRAQREVRVTE